MQELPMMDDFERKERIEKCARRLSVIEGQVRGVKRMIEEDTSNCVAILTQISSIHEALRSVGKEVMRKYLQTCATNAIKNGSDEVYDDLMDVIYKYAK
ncbi:metal-sensitive transcriptional regulator [Fodinisporobacter ferrooxydans]|uniref:Metal-sensitive transcriptional regulator n=1 Tax=Fodinisporobacter ferrooxydans TaxID=2901836 RepID=A0ABY4CPB5_9BACL|nr:metal-sensitive transcriptional regulator [Alicyclobacillaceae bacterium MYW30-H2]UOF92337.1 metal-sensitive transcriptional regulator [Alicyclobacillaceae bacterium MYW30-H2]